MDPSILEEAGSERPLKKAFNHRRGIQAPIAQQCDSVRVIPGQDIECVLILMREGSTDSVSTDEYESKFRVAI